jgi:hypothetical protein
VWPEAALAALLYFALTLVLAYPLSVHPATSILPVGADANLYLWTLQWDVHALVAQPLSIFDANIYYPFRHTLAYSENLIGSAVIAAPVLWATGNAVLAMNLVALLSCVLCGTGAYLLARRTGIGPGGATIAGIVFAFAPPRFFRLGQLHLTTVEWVPFCLAFLHKYFDSGRQRDLWWACFFFAAQVLTSAHGAAFCLVSALGFVLWHVALGDPKIRSLRFADVVVPVALAVAVSAIVFLPYRAVQKEMGLRRSLDEATSFSPTLASFVASPSRVHTFVLSRLIGHEIPADAVAFLFPGYLTLVLAAAGAGVAGSKRTRPTMRRKGVAAACLEIAIVASGIVAIVLTAAGGARLRYGGDVILSARRPWRAWLVCIVLVAVRAALLRRIPLAFASRVRAATRRARHIAEALRGNDVAFYAALALVTAWLSLGTPFGLYRLVYSWPGFSFIRVPSRFTIVTLLALAILAAAGFERLTQRFARRTRFVLAGIAAFALVAEFFAAPLGAASYRIDVPEVDRWLAGQAAPFVVAELPLARSNDVVVSARRQSLYMLHSTAHWQRTVHGYSGMQPALHDELFRQMLNFPDVPVLDRLASLGVTWIVVHPDLYAADEWRRVAARLDGLHDRLTLAHEDASGRAYSLRRPDDGARGTTRIFAR